MGMNELAALRRRFSGHAPGLLGARHEYAVLCPLVDTPEGLSLLYEVRAAGIRQGGEVCFPGGRLEPGESAADCALRETEEELSIPREAVELIGTPDFLCNQRGFILRPVLGYVKPEGFQAVRANPAEVAAVFTAPLSFLRGTPPEVYTYALRPEGPENFPYEKIGVPPAYPWAAGRVEVPVWYWRGRAIWGMTARITRAIIQEP